MRRHHQIAVIIIIIVLGLQFIVPVKQAFSDGSNRWGWQMYSREYVPPEIVAVSPRGERQAIDLREHLFLRRSELDMDVRMLEQLCERIDVAAMLEMVSRRTGEVTVHQCSD